MNEIKFRGKSLVPEDNGKWYFGYVYSEFPSLQCIKPKEPIKENLNHYIIFPGFADWNMPRPLMQVPVDPETVGQFINLQDKNKTDIYNGDIVKDDKGKVYLIKWGVNCDGWIAKTNEEHCNVYSIYHLANKVEVIGNIHDNPELNPELSTNLN
jgi:hypothetical protein